jgi:hypothetical protein
MQPRPLEDIRPHLTPLQAPLATVPRHQESRAGSLAGFIGGDRSSEFGMGTSGEAVIRTQGPDT